MPFDPATGAYVDTGVARGFPMGGIGAGGFGFDADGSFGELRLNNNWMCPVRGARGCFHALFTEREGECRMLLLRRASAEREYDGVRNVRSTRFVGLLPAFTLAYEDDLPLRVELAGFTPHVPHDVRDSTLPAAAFRFRLENSGAARVTASVLFSFENVLGRGGSGNLGLVLGPEHEARGVRERIVYDSVAGNFQEEAAVGGRRGVRFRTAQRWDERSHRSGVAGEYLLLAEAGPGIDVTVCDGWNADDARPALLDDFARDGRIRSRDAGRRGEDGVYRPAAAVATATTLAPGEIRDLVFALAWWTPHHVTEPDLARDRPSGPHRGVRVGHVYERWFRGPDDVARHLLDGRERLAAASSELPRLVADASLPAWLARAIVNSIDSTLCNSIVPLSGALHTLEGMDWRWPMGGLTGTMDQRLSAHPYTSVFFTQLDVRELAEFRALADARGAIPHGNGNSDLALGSTDVPYGWPLYVKGFLPAKEWTDLTMSFVVQVGKLWRLTGDRALLEAFWPALVRGMEYLDSLAPAGVPEGGTTYDVWDFPGAFIYTATVYLAALATMIDVASRAEPALVERYRERHRRCAQRVERDLWNPRGYFQTTETHDTIFTAALAGDWAARYAGLPPVVDPVRAASHLRHQHRVLLAEPLRAAGGRSRPMPRAEARFDGTPVVHPLAAGLPEGEDLTYVWQVLSYQGMEQIYLGQVDAGLETLRTIYDRIWHAGNAWSAGLQANADSVYMTHPVAWAALNALTGAALDVPGRTLFLAPRSGREIAELRCPFFFPSFWARLEHRPAAGHADVEVLRTFGEPVTIDRVVERDVGGEERAIEIGPTRLVAGQRLRLPLHGSGCS
jgi:uncharacterized protein (DUF608 family)